MPVSFDIFFLLDLQEAWLSAVEDDTDALYDFFDSIGEPFLKDIYDKKGMLSRDKNGFYSPKLGLGLGN